LPTLHFAKRYTDNMIYFFSQTGYQARRIRDVTLVEIAINVTW